MEAVKIIGVMVTAVLRALEIAGHLRGSFVTLTRRWRKPRPARVYSPAKYQIYTMNPTIREHLPPGVDPRAWPWRAAGPPRHQ